MDLYHQLAFVGATVGPILVTSCLFTMIMAVRREIRGFHDNDYLSRVWFWALLTGSLGCLAWWGGNLFLRTMPNLPPVSWGPVGMLP